MDATPIETALQRIAAATMIRSLVDSMPHVEPDAEARATILQAIGGIEKSAKDRLSSALQGALRAHVSLEVPPSVAISSRSSSRRRDAFVEGEPTSISEGKQPLKSEAK